MKELLSFLSTKTQTLVGQRFSRYKVHNADGSRVAQARLAFFAEAAGSIGPDTDIAQWVDYVKGLKPAECIVAFEASFGTAVCLDASHPREQSRVAQMVELAPDHLAGLGLGAGHALATLNIDADITPAIAEHYLGWMAMDAYGMDRGYFHWYDSVQNMRMPENLPPLAMAAFDQGLGRALWFISNADPDSIRQLTDRFSDDRQPNLWRGIGLMTGFWGAEESQSMKKLLKYAGQYRHFFQQGVAHAVSFRVDLGDVPDYSKTASELICRASVEEIADLSERLLIQNTGETFDSKAYLGWQNGLVKFFANST